MMRKAGSTRHPIHEGRLDDPASIIQASRPNVGALTPNWATDVGQSNREIPKGDNAMVKTAADFPITRPDLPSGIRLIENLYLTMRDGIKIAVDVYLPEEEGRYPVILAICPYKKEAQALSPNRGFHSEGGDLRFFVPRGYVMVFATTRGSGFSQGEFTAWGLPEQQDGYDIVEEIAKQPWCDGNVGMLGGSYLGMSQWYTAAQRPPHLRCITPIDASTDLYRDFVYQLGGMFYKQFMQMWGPQLYDELMFPGPIEGKAPAPNLFGQWMSNYMDGPYYQERSAINFIDKIEVPVLAVLAGAGIMLHSAGMLRGFSKIKAKPFKVVVGPGSPGMYAVIYWDNERFYRYVVRWLDHWLKGIDTGILDEPPVMIYDNGTGQWRYENEIPPFPRTEWTSFYLRSAAASATQPEGGLLSLEAPSGDEAPDTVKTNPTAPGPASGPNVVALTYATAQLERSVTVNGPASLTLWASTKTIDTSLWAHFVTIGDMAPDGSVCPVSNGNLKSYYREVDESESSEQWPWHPFTRKQHLEPDTVYDFLIQMKPIWHTFQEGHRIVVQITNESPFYKLDNFTDPVPGPYPSENSVYHDRLHPSHLMLPVISNLDVVKGRPEPVF
jgi:predicted acyl esterase